MSLFVQYNTFILKQLKQLKQLKKTSLILKLTLILIILMFNGLVFNTPFANTVSKFNSFSTRDEGTSSAVTPSKKRRSLKKTVIDNNTDVLSASETPLKKKKKKKTVVIDKENNNKENNKDTNSTSTTLKVINTTMPSVITPYKATTKAIKSIKAVSDYELAQVYQAIANGDSTVALKKVESLLAIAPNYRLLHLLRADLLLILGHKSTYKTRKGTVNALPTLTAEKSKRVEELKQEAWLRLTSHAAIKKITQNDLVPKALVKLANNEPYAFIVDSKISRLYVYQQQGNGVPKLIKDMYVTQGKLGINKAKESDQRTPVGVYFLYGQLKETLPDFYGYGALPLDYPNLWDRRFDRTGHGIWLHGTPSDMYARAPYASNGCVVLANPDIEMLIKLQNNGSVPVIVSDNLEWVSPTTLYNDQKSLLSHIEQWRKTIESGDNTTLMNLYSPEFKTESYSSTAVSENKLTFVPKKSIFEGIKTDIKNVAIIDYPNQSSNVMVSKFDYVIQSNHRKPLTYSKQLYWKRTGEGWKIILENT